MQSILRITLLLCALMAGTRTALAYKVKFAVDMRNETVNTTGVHVFGDFQMDAGYASNWAPDLTLLKKETNDTNIYSIVLDVKAAKKYEYKFLNGDQSYEAEFVPDESRVGYDFNDNRWIFTDSLKNDTFFVGVIPFAGNAPAGTKLIRFKMKLKTSIALDPNGVHVAGDFQGWDTKKTIMYSLKAGIYEVIQYVKTDTVQFKYYNGNLAAGIESVPANCAFNGNRRVILLKDSVLPTVCFSECTNCAGAGLLHDAQASISVYPNPSGSGGVHVQIPGTTCAVIEIVDARGVVVFRQQIPTRDVMHIGRDAFPCAGMYRLKCTTTDGGLIQTPILIEY